MDKGIYIDSKGKQHLVSRMNFVYLQNAINKLKQIEEDQQLNENHDLVKKRIELEAEYQSRPEYQPPNLPKFVPSSMQSQDEIGQRDMRQNYSGGLPNHHTESGPMPKAKPKAKEWDIDDDF